MLREVKGTLLPCPSCFRHVRLGSRSCPFCAGALPDAFDREGPTLLRRKTRFGAYSHTAATVAVLAAAGCGDLAPSGVDASVYSSSDGANVDAIVMADVSSLQKETEGVPLDGGMDSGVARAADSGEETSTEPLDAGPCESGPPQTVACGDLSCGTDECYLIDCQLRCFPPPPPPYGAPHPPEGDE